MGTPFQIEMGVLAVSAVTCSEDTKDAQLLLVHFRIKLLFYTGYLPNEDGMFNPFLAEQIQDCEKLKLSVNARVRHISESALRELGVYI